MSPQPPWSVNPHKPFYSSLNRDKLLTYIGAPPRSRSHVDSRGKIQMQIKKRLLGGLTFGISFSCECISNWVKPNSTSANMNGNGRCVYQVWGGRGTCDDNTHPNIQNKTSGWCGSDDVMRSSLITAARAFSLRWCWWLFLSSKGLVFDVVKLSGGWGEC